MFRYFLCIVLFFLLPLPDAFSQIVNPRAGQFEPSKDPVRIRADRVTYDKAIDRYIAEGNVEIWQGNRRLTADFVTLDSKSDEAEAIGHVVIVQGTDVLQGERMKIDLETNLGIIIQGTLFLRRQHYYLRGEEIERVGEDTYLIRNGSFTTCDGDVPAWRFTGREALVTFEEYATVQWATFQIKNIPIFYLPYLVVPVKTERQSGFLIPRVGYSTTAGVLFDNAYFWAISKNTDATFYLDLESARGIGEGLEYRYVRTANSLGKFYGYHISEMESYRNRRTEQLDRSPDRWILDFQHQEYFQPNLYANMRLREISDRQYFRDYSKRYEEQFQEQIYSFASLTKDWERMSLYGEARRTVDLRAEDKSTLQTYPVVNFSAIPRRVLGPVHLSADSLYAYYYQESGAPFQRLDINPRLSLPWRWKAFDLTPELGGRETLYLTDSGEQIHRTLWDFNLTGATEISRIYDTGSERIPKLKHLIRPELTYTYIPNVDQTNIPLPARNIPVPVTLDQSFGIMNLRRIYNYDFVIPQKNAFTLSVTQRLIGKIVNPKNPDAPASYHEYAYLRLSQSYDINETTRSLTSDADQRRPYGVTTAEVRIQVPYVSLYNLSSYDLNTQAFLSSYSSVGMNDKRGDSLSVGYSWESGQASSIIAGLPPGTPVGVGTNQVSAYATVRVLPSLDLTYGLQYSLVDNLLIDTRYGVIYRSQCWSVEFIYIQTPVIAGTPAENKFMLLFNLGGLTSIGLK